MKFPLIVFVIMLTSVCLLSQKQDNIWLLGYNFEQEDVNRPFGGTDLSFNSDGSVDTTYVPRKVHFDNSNASICDSVGNLLFYTNGIYVFKSRSSIDAKW